MSEPSRTPASTEPVRFVISACVIVPSDQIPPPERVAAVVSDALGNYGWVVNAAARGRFVLFSGGGTTTRSGWETTLASSEPRNAASRISQEVRDRDELGSLVAWLRGRTTYSASIPDGCGEPWLAALERILAHIDREGMHYADQHTVAEPNLPEGVLWALKSEDFMAMVNEVSLASRGLPEHLSDAEREAKKCDCGYPEKPCLRIMLRNGPPFPPRPCEPIQRPA